MVVGWTPTHTRLNQVAAASAHPPQNSHTGRCLVPSLNTRTGQLSRSTSGRLINPPIFLRKSCKDLKLGGRYGELESPAWVPGNSICTGGISGCQMWDFWFRCLGTKSGWFPTSNHSVRAERLDTCRTATVGDTPSAPLSSQGQTKSRGAGTCAATSRIHLSIRFHHG